MLFADPGAGKTTVAVDIAYSVATGTPWNGRHAEQGHVLYVVGEDLDGVKKRAQAWGVHRGVDLADAPISSRGRPHSILGSHRGHPVRGRSREHALQAIISRY